jgi:hypothetical protein
MTVIYSLGFIMFKCKFAAKLLVIFRQFNLKLI